MDSIEVTLRRTAAASALAARFLARPDSRTLLICGCGAQGFAHLEALREVLPLDAYPRLGPGRGARTGAAPRRAARSGRCRSRLRPPWQAT